MYVAIYVNALHEEPAVIYWVVERQYEHIIKKTQRQFANCNSAIPASQYWI